MKLLLKRGINSLRQREMKQWLRDLNVILEDRKLTGKEWVSRGSTEACVPAGSDLLRRELRHLL